jgi:hypothetical protein
MQNAETVLGVLRDRGRRGLPLDELYRQLFNPQLYLLAIGRDGSAKRSSPTATPPRPHPVARNWLPGS